MSLFEEISICCSRSFRSRNTMCVWLNKEVLVVISTIAHRPSHICSKLPLSCITTAAAPSSPPFPRSKTAIVMKTHSRFFICKSSNPSTFITLKNDSNLIHHHRHHLLYRDQGCYKLHTNISTPSQP